MSTKLKLYTYYLILIISCISSQAQAAVYDISTKSGTTLPTRIVAGGKVTAFYTVSNSTSRSLSNNYVRSLPPNVTQIVSGGTYPNTCGNMFDLAPGSSCTLQLSIHGAVNAQDPDPNHHILVCLKKCKVCCSGTYYPLNVTVLDTSTLSLKHTPTTHSAVNVAYNQTNLANGGSTPYIFNILSGALPAGTTLNTSSGTVAGTPTTAGAFSYTIRTGDADGATATASSSGNIASALTLTASPTTYAAVNAAYSQTNLANGGSTPFVFNISSGSLPAGTALNTSSGNVAGTPTTVGPFSYTISVSDADGAIATASSSGNIAQTYYTVTASGDNRESITPNTPQTVAYQKPISFIVAANPGYTQSQTVGGTCPAGHWSGITYTTGSITTACSVSFSATSNASNLYTISGIISGLSLSGLTLQNSNGETLPVSANGPFIFATQLPAGENYDVIVSTQPTGQICSVNNGAGTISSEVSSVSVNCIADNLYSVGGTLSGLAAGTSVIIKNVNNNSKLTLVANAHFTFTQALNSGEAYSINVMTQPSRQNCTISNASGYVASTNVSNVSINCASSFTPTYAYVANAGSNTVSICPLANEGAEIIEGTCTTDPIVNSYLNMPLAIVLNPPGDYLYIANGGNTLTICQITNNGGSLGPCTNSSGSGTFNLPDGIGFNPLNRFVYLSNFSSGALSTCPIISNGAAISGCTATNVNSAMQTNAVQSIILNASGTYAYVTSGVGGSPPANSWVSVCAVTNGGRSITSCATPFHDNSFNYPEGLAMNADSSYAYIGNASNNSISICQAANDGSSLSNCQSYFDYSFAFNNTNQVGLYMSSQPNPHGITYGYIPNNTLNSNGQYTVSICPITAAGATVGPCAGYHDSTFNAPSGLALY